VVSVQILQEFFVQATPVGRVQPLSHEEAALSGSASESWSFRFRSCRMPCG
jgi:hypothetical protein